MGLWETVRQPFEEEDDAWMTPYGQFLEVSGTVPQRYVRSCMRMSNEV